MGDIQPKVVEKPAHSHKVSENWSQLTFGKQVGKMAPECMAGHKIWPWNSTSKAYSKGIRREAHKLYM